MEAMRFEREGRVVGDGEGKAASSPTKSSPEQGQEGCVVSTKSEDGKAEEESGPGSKETADKANMDSGKAPNVTESDT